jgi:predicted nucleic acid-binding Zn ribbon protein
MPTYVYETIPAKRGRAPKRYELKQSIKDAAFTKHPETGEPIKRVVTGGIGVLTSSSASYAHAHAHRPSCGCGAGGCHG